MSAALSLLIGSLCGRSSPHRAMLTACHVKPRDRRRRQVYMSAGTSQPSFTASLQKKKETKMVPIQSLLLLSGASVVLLWGTMLINGTLNGVSLAAKHGYFPDGRPIRQTFTGYPSVDGNLVVVVAFFDMLITARNVHAPRWLFFEMCNVLAAINTWVLIESRRRGVRNFFLRQLVISSSSAIVLPG